MVWTRTGCGDPWAQSKGSFSRVIVRAFSSQRPKCSEQPAASARNRQPMGGPKRGRGHSPQKVIYSGIQPTGVPHLGNYLGALRQWKQFQDEKTREKKTNQRLIFSVVDLHALTHSQRPQDLLLRRKETFASLLAIGLDPRHSLVYFQSAVPGHAQLMWYLSHVASTGYLSRMTQWKSKLGVSDDATLEDQAAREKLRLGLFSYPVLQAADILLYNTDVVPVGEDQEQHVEFARTLARSFNAQYREANNGRDLFKIPKALISPAKRIMSLKDPTAKMSKSHADPKSRILITDDPEDVYAKIKGALTDSVGGISYDPENRPGVSNLVEMLKHIKHPDVSCEELAADNANQNIRAFKEHVAEEIVKSLTGIRDRFNELLHPNNTEMSKAVSQCYKVVTSLAGNKLAEVERVMGLSDVRSKIETRESMQEKREAMIGEQEEMESSREDEPDVVPQKDEGVDHPIAS